MSGACSPTGCAGSRATAPASPCFAIAATYGSVTFVSALVDVIGTAIQVKELALAGSELVRITVNTPEAAEAVPVATKQVAKAATRERLPSSQIALPPALGDYRPTGATFEDGALRVTFDRETATADA